jgi:cell division protein FtsB
MEKEAKERNRMTKAQSHLVCELFASEEGNWKRIMADARIRRLGQSKEYLATHIQNKKKRVRQLAKQEEAVEEDENENEGETPPRIRKRPRIEELVERQEALELTVAELQGTLSEILEELRGK